KHRVGRIVEDAALDQGQVDLDDVELDLGQEPEAGVAGAAVVRSEADAGGSAGGRIVPQAVEVVDLLPLGQLDDELGRKDPAAFEDGRQLARMEQLRFERARGQVDAQVDVRLELADAVGDHLQAGEIELDGPIGPFGGGEQGARVGDRGAFGPEGQARVADQLAGRQREDRLVDGPEHLVGQDRTDSLRQVLDRAII